LLTQLANHHRLDGRQQFCNDEGRKTEGGAKLQGGTHIPADNSTAAHPASHTHLTAEPLNKVPDLPTLKG
jgi:hypothetical protein